MENLETIIQDFKKSNKPDPRQFFLAWNISPAIIAERLRLIGLPATSKEIGTILNKGINTPHQLYQLTAAMMEMRNDVTRTLPG